MLGAGRVFRMLGGYAKNSQMEKLGTMLNDGQPGTDPDHCGGNEAL